MTRKWRKILAQTHSMWVTAAIASISNLMFIEKVSRATSLTSRTHVVGKRNAPFHTMILFHRTEKLLARFSLITLIVITANSKKHVHRSTARN